MQDDAGMMTAEAAIRSALSQVPELKNRPYTVDRINGGITNLNWLVKGEDGGRFFAKIMGRNTEVFIDRELAHEAALRAAETGYAPAILFLSEDGSLEVQEFLQDYRSCNVADLLDPEVRANIVSAYRALHGAEPLSRAHTGFQQLHDRLKLVKQHGARLPRDIDHLMWQCKRAEQAIGAAGFDLRLCYNDAYVTNYMVNAKKDVKIIDWEYASNNDPYWDLALFSAETFLDETPVLAEIIEMHDGRYTAEAEARIILYCAVGYLAWSFWASLQAKISEIAFDYAKYSELLTMRVRQWTTSPRWEKALLTL